MVGELSYPGRDLVSVSVVVDMGLSEKKGEASKSHGLKTSLRASRNGKLRGSYHFQRKLSDFAWFS